MISDYAAKSMNIFRENEVATDFLDKNFCNVFKTFYYQSHKDLSDPVKLLSSELAKNPKYTKNTAKAHSQNISHSFTSQTDNSKFAQ